MYRTMTIKQSKNWCLTDFENLDFRAIYNKNKDKIRYICWGREICPRTNKEHIQGWIQFNSKRRLGGVKKIIGSKKTHLEACLGTEAQNDKYCTKDGNYESIGQYIKQGQRMDLQEIHERIKEGAKREEILEADPISYCKYRRGILDMCELAAKKRAKESRDLEVIYIHGDTGSGKSKYGYENSEFMINGFDMQWWDGYEGEKAICIDDYDSDVPITKLLKLLDRYPMRLPVKGGFTYAEWTKVIITSNIPLEELHPNAKECHRKALRRRITKVVPMWSGNTDPTTVKKVMGTFMQTEEDI